MKVYIYITELPKTPLSFLHNENNPLEFTAIHDSPSVPLDTTLFRCALPAEPCERLNTEIINEIGGEHYINNGAIEMSFADIKRLSTYIYSRHRIPNESRGDILLKLNGQQNYEYFVDEQRYALMPPHHQKHSQTAISQQDVFDELFAMFARPATNTSNTLSDWHDHFGEEIQTWFTPVATLETPASTMTTPNTSTTSTTTTTTTTISTLSIPTTNPIYELKDETVWEHNLDNGLVTLLSHPVPATTFKSEFALKMIDANALDAQKKEDLTVILFSDLPLQEFQLDIDDFCKLYTEVDFIGNKPPVKISQALETGIETINESLEDIYEFIEQYCSELSQQQKLLNMLLKIDVQSSNEQVTVILTKITQEFAFGTKKSFMDSVNYFATGLRGLDDLHLLKSVFATQIGHNRTQIHDIYQGFIADKLAAIVQIINAKNKREVIEICDEPSAPLLYSSQHKRSRHEESVRAPNKTSQTTTLLSVTPEKRPRY